MFARVTMTQAALDRADEAVRVNKERVIPGAEGIAGFKGGLWLLDRMGSVGRCLPRPRLQPAELTGVDADEQSPWVCWPSSSNRTPWSAGPGGDRAHCPRAPRARRGDRGRTRWDEGCGHCGHHQLTVLLGDGLPDGCEPRWIRRVSRGRDRRVWLGCPGVSYDDLDTRGAPARVDRGRRPRPGCSWRIRARAGESSRGLHRGQRVALQRRPVQRSFDHARPLGRDGRRAGRHFVLDMSGPGLPPWPRSWSVRMARSGRITHSRPDRGHGQRRSCRSKVRPCLTVGQASPQGCQATGAG